MPPIIADRGEDCEQEIHDTAHAYNKGCRCPRAVADKTRIRKASEERRREGNLVPRERGEVRDWVVKELIAGRQPIAATRGEKAEAIEHLLIGGAGPTAVALVIGTVTLRTVQRYQERLRKEQES